MSDLPVFSASKLKTFQSCPRKYYYQYIERLPQDKSSAGVLGTVIHRTIEKVYRERVEPVSYFSAEFLKELATYNLELDNTQMMDGIKMVADYPYHLSIPDQLEYEFRLPFPSKASPVCMIHGFFDQIFDWGFIDLKSSKRKPTQDQLNNDLQFILYSWAFEQIFGTVPKAIWHHLRTQRRMEADTAGKADIALGAIESIFITQILGEYVPIRAFHCRWCPFREPCFASDEV